MTRRNYLLGFLLSLFLCVHTTSSLKLRAEGDTIYHDCQNITEDLGITKLTINNACIDLSEGANCQVMAKLSIEGRSIFDKELSSEAAPQVCGDYNVQANGATLTCNICLKIDTGNSTHRCLSVKPTCSGIPFDIPAKPVGCFPSSRLTNVLNCKNLQCPNGCSQHGSCESVNGAGVCKCNSGWFGNDCSISSQLFEACRKVDELTGNVCVRLVFDSCKIKMQVLLQSGFLEIPLYNQDYSVSSFKSTFKNNISFVGGGCQNSLGWSNLVVNETQLSGCGHISLNCLGTSLYNYDLGCFLDKDVLPSCIGVCPTNCSGHGTCNQGVCSCNKGWTTDDCSVRGCQSNCGGETRGTCVNGVCQCSTHFSGDNCETYVGPTAGGETSSPAGSGIGIKIAVGLAIALFLTVAGVVVFYFVRKHRQNRARQHQRFELLDDDEGNELSG